MSFGIPIERSGDVIELSLKDVREAVARGWCIEENAGKVMDVALAEAIAAEVMKLVAPKWSDVLETTMEQWVKREERLAASRPKEPPPIQNEQSVASQFPCRRRIYFVGNEMLRTMLSGGHFKADNVPEGAVIVGVAVNFEMIGIDVMMVHDSFPEVAYGEHVERHFLKGSRIVDNESLLATNRILSDLLKKSEQEVESLKEPRCQCEVCKP